MTPRACTPKTYSNKAYLVAKWEQDREDRVHISDFSSAETAKWQTCRKTPWGQCHRSSSCWHSSLPHVTVQSKSFTAADVVSYQSLYTWQFWVAELSVTNRLHSSKVLVIDISKGGNHIQGKKVQLMGPQRSEMAWSKLYSLTWSWVLFKKFNTYKVFFY